MVIEDDSIKVLGYLKKHGQTNTFRLASELGVDRPRILNIVEKLEEKGAVEVRSGIVFFLKFPRKEKKVVKKKPVKKASSKPKKKAKRKPNVESLKAENIGLKEKLLELQNAPPKVIRRTRTKRIIKRVPVKSKKLEEQAEYITKLEKTIKGLEQKVATPKIIRRTIVKQVPKIIRKIIIRKVPVKVKEKVPKKEIKQKRFKLPKISLSELGKNIKKLNVPEMLKK